MTTFEAAAPSPELLGPAVGEYRAPLAVRPLRVVYLSDADYPWDVRTEKICATLTSAGHQVHIVARNRAWRVTEERLLEGTMHRMKPWRWIGQRADGVLGFPAFFSPRWRRLLDDTVRRVHPDVIVARDLPLAPTAIAIGRRRRVPVVLDIAENYPAMMQMIFDARRQRPLDYVVRNPAAVAAVERYSLARADRVLVVADEMASRVERLGTPRERIDIVSNTPPRARAKSAPTRQAKTAGEPLTLVYLGILELPRGVMELIDAVALLRDQGHIVRCSVVGDGRDASLFHERARALRLDDGQIRFHGYLKHAAALEVVRDADLGVLPHHATDAWNTTLPNKLFDYMAFALPVLTSSVEPCARIVRETGAGAVFDSGSAIALANAVRQLSDDAARRACGVAGQRAVLERYHWERDADVLLGALELTARSAARAH